MASPFFFTYNDQVSLNYELIQSCIDGDIKSVRKYFNMGVDPAFSFKNEDCAFIHACKKNHLKIVKFLSASKRKKYNTKILVNLCDLVGTTPLMIASKNNYVNMFNYLIKCGSKVNVKDYFGYTALHFATKFNNEQIIESLLNMRANIDIRDMVGNKAIYWARQNKNEKIINLFEERDKRKNKQLH